MTRPAILPQHGQPGGCWSGGSVGWGFGEDLLEASSGGLVHLVVDAFGLGSVAGVEVAVAAVTVTAGRCGAGRL